MKSRAVSVLMAVYAKDKPQWFKEAVDSILNQTLSPHEIIVVVDGPVPQPLREIIVSYGKRIRPIWLSENKGLWNALNVGLDEARCELVARMDSDDIAATDRIEKQVAAFELNSKLAVVGGQIAEFEKSTDNVVSYRHVPMAHTDIMKFAKFRSPFNHPSVMFRKSAVIDVGGYAELYRTEDYDLWVRLLMGGYETQNLPDILLCYRVNGDSVIRRANAVQHSESLRLLGKLYESKYITPVEYVVASLMKRGFYLLPISAKNLIYRKVLRK